jgi:hypothetical protein
MPRKLSDVVAELSQAGTTGILSIAVTGDPSLFKLFFRDGFIYHITHGSCSDRDCLAKLATLSLDATTFMPGAHVDIKTPSLPKMPEIISQLAALGKTVRWEPKPGADVKGKPSASATTQVTGPMIEKLKDELVNVIGPVASMVLEQAMNACGIKNGASLSELDFKRLVSVLSERLPEEQKKTFLQKFSA